MADGQDKSGRPSAIGPPSRKWTSIDFKGIYSGYSVELQATLIDVDRNPIPGKEIEIYSKRVRDRVEYYGITGKTDEEGVVVVDAQYRVEFRGDEEYGNAEAGAPRPPCSIFYNPEQAAQAKKTKLTLDVVYSGDSAQLTARLTDLDGNPLPGEEIRFEGATSPGSYAWSGSAVTDDQGAATVTAPRYNWYRAMFLGDEERLYDCSEAWFTALPKPVLTFEAEHNSSTAKLRAKLTDSDGNPLPDKSIDFGVVFNGRWYLRIDTVDTDEAGVVATEIQFNAVFNGDDQYEASEALAQFLAQEPSPSPSPSPSPTLSPSPSPTPSACCSFWDIGCWFLRPDRTVYLFGKEINGMLLSIAFIAIFLVARRRRSARTSE